MDIANISPFSIGDTVSFDWNGFKMIAIVISMTRTYSYNHPGIKRVDNRPSTSTQINYVVEMNFKRTSIKYAYGHILQKGLCTESSDKLSMCRMVLIEKINNIFSNNEDE